ncbi:MAG: hypothetical protein MUC63_05910 [Planctomycetes bacterium]|nr:hypothetical protein [Planctomycetota bacterium]
MSRGRSRFRAAAAAAALLVAAAGALGARSLLKPATWGDAGPYRAAAAEELRARPSLHAGSESCRECHEEAHRFWSYRAHKTIACEACHGPLGEHGRKDIEPRPDLFLGGNEQCMTCHRKIGGRPEAAVSQIESLDAHMKFLEGKHFIRVKRAKSVSQCVFCHDPHLLQ